MCYAEVIFRDLTFRFETCVTIESRGKRQFKYIEPPKGTIRFPIKLPRV